MGEDRICGWDERTNTGAEQSSGDDRAAKIPPAPD
jgi:hypothetical protein